MATVHFSQNTNNQRLEDGLAEGNIAVSEGRGASFKADILPNLDRSKAVVVFGGGPSLRAEVDGGSTRLMQINEREDCVKVAAGSALNLLDAEKARLPGQYLEKGADVVVFNAADTPDDADYYKGFKKVPDGMPVILASYNGQGAYDHFDNGEVVRANAYVPGVNYGDEDAIGLGSTTPSAAIALMARMGFTKFELPGVDGASAVQVPEGAELSTLQGQFETAGVSAPEEPPRYPLYEMMGEYNLIDPADKLTVYVGNDRVAHLPRGQWELLKNIDHIRQETGGNLEFTFYGETVIADHFVRGQAITLVNDPEGLIPAGTKLEGAKPSPDPAAKPEPGPSGND